MTKNHPFRFFISLVLVFTNLATANAQAIGHTNEPTPVQQAEALHLNSGDGQIPPGSEAPPPGDDKPMSHRFQMLLYTNEQSHVPGNSGALPIEFESVPVDQMGAMITRTKARGLLPDWAKNPPTIWIYLPNQETYDEAHVELAAQARANFRLAYPGVDPKIRFRIDKSDVTVDVLYSVLSKEVEAQKNVATDQAHRDIADIQAQMLKASYEETKQKHEFTAGKSKRYKTRVAWSRASFILVSRGLLVAPAFGMGLGPATIALTLSVADAGVELFTANFSQRMQKFLSRNPFPLEERTLFEGKKYAVNTATINGMTSVALNTFWNVMIFVVIRATLMQSLQHAALPDVIAWPLLPTLVVTTLANTPVALLNGFFVKGYKQLADKGWMSAATLDMVLQFMAIPDTGNNFANSMPAKLGWIRWITMPALVALFVGVGAAGAMLPRKADRIVMIHEGIGSREEVRMEQPNVESAVPGISTTLKVPYDNDNVKMDENWRKALEAVNELRRQRNQCEMDLEAVPNAA